MPLVLVSQAPQQGAEKHALVVWVCDDEESMRHGERPIRRGHPVCSRAFNGQPATLHRSGTQESNLLCSRLAEVVCVLRFNEVQTTNLVLAAYFELVVWHRRQLHRLMMKIHLL